MASDDSFDGVIPVDVDFLYKEREAGKRRVKPVAPKFTQLFTDLNESADESDTEFKCPDSASECSDNRSFEEDLSQSENDESESVSVAHTPELEDDKENKHSDDDFLIDLEKLNPLKICCICLERNNTDDNELVQCDNCALRVHENCYGISDISSLNSDSSSSCTEPWFCDACKAGVNPECELCPNDFGLFKKCENGKWVHLICAFYIKGVEFLDVDTFSPVVLHSIQPSKYGTKICNLCSDKRLARSGICISCEAGLCKRSFHVTCAQKEGYLIEDNAVNDPFFAYCYQHSKDEERKIRKQNFSLFMSLSKTDRKKLESAQEKERNRINKYLLAHKEKFLKDEVDREYKIKEEYEKNKNLKNSLKIPRSITSCPSVVKMFIKKAEISGFDTTAFSELKTVEEIRNMSIPARFTSQFVEYFHLRQADEKRLIIENKQKENKIKIWEKKVKELLEKKNSLRLQKNKMISSLLEAQGTGFILYNHLRSLIPQLEIPHYLKPIQPVLSLQNIAFTAKSTETNIKKMLQNKFNNLPKRNVIKDGPDKCTVCQTNITKINSVKCDQCHLIYHFKCLIPPLKRSPKQPGYGWHCKHCDSSESGNDEDECKIKKRKVTLKPSKYQDGFVNSNWIDNM